MKLPVALALAIGVAGAVIAYLYLGPLSGLGLFVPATFLGAATFFSAGGDRPALVTTLATNIWGIVTGTVMRILAGLTTNPALLGLIIGGMTAVFILDALVPALGVRARLGRRVRHHGGVRPAQRRLRHGLLAAHRPVHGDAAVVRGRLGRARLRLQPDRRPPDRPRHGTRRGPTGGGTRCDW
ncbi:DUF1097 domain-containing protein [Pseudonocardia sp. HH130629-09]|uniref:DUF1097 domain-containing protein n=1 Tax=Pseudonocardia sp. HH130629-09 TaxID=1641402 RepID=UPI0009EBE5FF|nr:DUF1097 domain-containing protein [Pseudonocardia sp. HH130629-09]